MSSVSFKYDDPAASARSHAYTNHALHELNVAQPPAHYEFIEFCKPLADVDPVTIAAFVPIQREHCPGACVESFALRRVLIELEVSHGPQCVEENIVQGRLAQSPFQQSVRFRRRPVIAQHFLVLQAAQEFQLAKLFRLKSAGWFQLAAERQKVGRQHGLENRELFHQHASNFRAAPQQARRFIDLVARLGIRTRSSQI